MTQASVNTNSEHTADENNNDLSTKSDVNQNEASNNK